MKKNMKPYAIETPQDFIDETERKIINEELPVLVRYLGDMELLLQQSQDRSHIEMETRDEYLHEIRRVTGHIATRVHQLINIPTIRQMLDASDLRVMETTLAGIIENGHDDMNSPGT